jgi:hypothetical protein
LGKGSHGRDAAKHLQTGRQQPFTSVAIFSKTLQNTLYEIAVTSLAAKHLIKNRSHFAGGVAEHRIAKSPRSINFGGFFISSIIF